MDLVSGNIFIREMILKEGDVVNGHTHNFDHTTFVPKGSVKIEILDEDGNPKTTVVKKAGFRNWVLIKANACHRLTALEDDTVCHCIYSHNTPQDEISQVYTGWEDAYV